MTLGGRWAGVVGLTVALASFAAFAPGAQARPRISSTRNVLLGSGASGGPSSLPVVASGHRPGPDVLYAAPPSAPQLENRDPRFHAPPLLVSGTEAYVDGEYLYQDYIYDDHGSDTDGSTGGPGTYGGNITYPTDDARYAGNAADLVEFRVAPSRTSVAYRFTLNSLPQADTTIITLAFDTDHNPATGQSTLPRDPGAPFPGTDEVITTWGTGAEHSTLVAGQRPVTTPAAVHEDLVARQITVTVPRSVSNPTGSWRATLGVGLYDKTSGGWLRPTSTATRTQPGGSGGSPRNGIFNLGLRFDEPISGGHAGTPLVSPSAQPPDANQSVALSRNQPTTYAHDIDFTALAQRLNRTSVPSTGMQIRLFPSRLVLGQGIGDGPTARGQLQPYALLVPSKYQPGVSSMGFTLTLHSLSDHYWQYNNTLGIEEWSNQRDSFVASPDARDTNGWYRDDAEYDVFEMWNDVARHFTLDANRSAILGYSMGGYGTYRLASLYPDLFASAVDMVGGTGEGIWEPPLPPTGAARGNSRPPQASWALCPNLWLENVRHIPFFNIIAGEDEFTNTGAIATNLGYPGFHSFEQLGYRYRFRTYPLAEHLTLGGLSYDVPGIEEWLGRAQLDRDPSHVTFAYIPATDSHHLAPGVADLSLVHDHAYWISAVKLTNPKANPPLLGSQLSGITRGYSDDPAVLGQGVVDAVSHARGQRDPQPAREVSGGTGPSPLAWTEVGNRWTQPTTMASENTLDLSVANVGDVHLALARAGIDTSIPITISAVANAAGLVHADSAFGPGETLTVDGRAARLATTATGVVLPLVPGTHRYVLTPGRPSAPQQSGAAASAKVLPRTGGQVDRTAAILLLMLGLAAQAVSRRNGRPVST